VESGNIYVGASIPTPVTGLSVGAAYDYTYGSAGFAASYANATALYVAYQPTEKWKFNNRFDYARVVAAPLATPRPAGTRTINSSLTR